MDVVDTQVHANVLGTDVTLAIMDALGITGLLFDEYVGVDHDGAAPHPFPDLDVTLRRAVDASVRTASCGPVPTRPPTRGRTGPRACSAFATAHRCPSTTRNGSSDAPLESY
jgi:hypothetical protein